MEDLRNVNLSKFVSEAVTSICDAKLRTSDIQVAVQFLKGHSITTDQKKVFRKAFHTYYDGVAELLQSEHAI
uniref:Uncharacterized protein n=1 Tax=Salix viminalis TaxID=40686 RepID=A0A6N2M5P9_SALVM